MKLKTALSAFASGLIFAIGLGISGMTRPEKVLGFLDILGEWDPSLAFVMGGALLVYGALFRLITKRKSPLIGERFMVPTRRDINARLLIGATLFGVGWGIGGFCPGPALASIVTGLAPVLIFVASMLAGMGLFKLFDSALKKRRRQELSRPS